MQHKTNLDTRGLDDAEYDSSGSKADEGRKRENWPLYAPKLTSQEKPHQLNVDTAFPTYGYWFGSKAGGFCLHEFKSA